MITREPLQTAAYFDRDIQLLQDELLAVEEDKQLPAAEVQLDMVYFCEFKYRYELLFLHYSRGASLETLAADFPAMVAALEAYKQQPASEDIFFNGELDEYTLALALVSMALLLHVERDVFARLVAGIGANGQDYLVEWLIGRRLENRPRVNRLLFPKVYGRLRDAIQGPMDLQSALLTSYLGGWYESMNTTWYNAHLGADGGFTGYWCWEAAAVAYALGADDTELQAMRFYPKDLADYAFGRVKRPA